MKKRGFGCEFEFSSPFIDSNVELIKNKIAKYYGKRSMLTFDYMDSKNNKQWHLKKDATTSMELVTPVSYKKDIDRINNIIQSLEFLELSQRDSTHIHIYAKDLNINNIISLWIKWEPIILLAFPKHRIRNNVYCPRLTPIKNKNKNVFDIFKLNSKNVNDHHCIISSANMDEIGTMEFRIAEGVSSKLFPEWLYFCLNFIEVSQKIDPYKLLLENVRYINNKQYNSYEDAINEMCVDLEIQISVKYWLMNRIQQNYKTSFNKKVLVT